MKFTLRDNCRYEHLAHALPGFEEQFQSCCRAQFLKGDQCCVDVTSASGHTDNFEIYSDWHISFYFDEIYPIFEADDPCFIGCVPPLIDDEDWDKRAFCEIDSTFGTFRCIAEWTGKYWSLISFRDRDGDHQAAPAAIAPTRYMPTSSFPYCCAK